MNKNIYTDLEELYTSFENNFRSFCPHCGNPIGISLIKSKKRAIIDALIPTRCRYCRKWSFNNIIISSAVLMLVSAAIVSSILYMIGNAELGKILAAITAGLGVLFVVLSYMDVPRSNFTTFLNRYVPGKRIYIETHRQIVNMGVFRRGQMYIVTPSDVKNNSWIAICQADKVTSNTLVLRVVKVSEEVSLLSQDVFIKPSLIDGIYGTVCREIDA